VVGCWHGCLGWGADLHIAQQMPLPLTISCSSKSRLVLTFLGLPFWYLLTRVDPDIFQTSSKTVVCELPFNCLFSRTTYVSQHQNGGTILDFNEARGVAVASAGPYANNLHFAAGK